MNQIKRLIQKIRCSIPFNLTYFGHKNVVVVRQLSPWSQLIKCRDCGKLFAINHDIRVVLPWESVRFFHEEMEKGKVP